MKILIKSLLVGMVILFSISCKKEAVEEDIPKVKKLKKVFINGKIDSQYFYTDDKISEAKYYNEQGIIDYKKIISYPTSNKMQILYYTQNEANVLIKYAKEVYVYSGGLVSLVDKFSVVEDNETLYEKVIYTNREHENHNIIKANFYDENNNLTGWYESDYTDENGSSIAIYYNANNEASYTDKWVRDDKKGAYYSVNPFPYQHIHNVVYRRVTFPNGNIWNYSFSSVLQYDEEGYPTKTNLTYHNGEEKVYNYEYFE